MQFSQLDASNSELLGANFVLQFEEPLPISITTAKLLQKVTNLDTPFFHESVAKLDDLIIEQTYGLTRETWSEEEFFIQLPGDMYHEFRCLPSDKDNIGLMIYKIPFNQAAQLPHIMKVSKLKLPLAFNFNHMICCLNDIFYLFYQYSDTSLSSYIQYPFVQLPEKKHENYHK